jgi:hypothetical protein
MMSLKFLTIKFESWQIDKESHDLFFQNLANISELIHLNLNMKFLSLTGEYSLGQVLKKHCYSLRKFYLNLDWSVDDIIEQLREFTEILGSLKYLYTFKTNLGKEILRFLKYYNGDKTVFSEFKSRIHGMTYLENLILQFTYSNLSLEQVINIAECLKDLDNLKYLDLNMTKCGVTSDRFDRILSSISNRRFRKIMLDFSGNEIKNVPASRAKSIFDNLSSNEYYFNNDYNFENQYSKELWTIPLSETSRLNMEENNLEYVEKEILRSGGELKYKLIL